MNTTIITGGAGGIGVETARFLLASEPTCHVALVDLGDPELPPAVEEFGERVRRYSCDVTDPESVASTETTIDGDLPPVTGLVNVAGVLRIATSLTLDHREFEEILSVHLTGTLLWSQALARMVDGRPGVIVNVSSVAGQFGQPGRLAYGAAKAAIRSMTQTLAVEWAPRHIRVNCVAPGYIATPMLAAVRTHSHVDEDTLARHSALDRIGNPGEVGAAIAFLLRDDAAFITGHTLNVDGGFAVKKLS